MVLLQDKMVVHVCWCVNVGVCWRACVVAITIAYVYSSGNCLLKGAGLLLPSAILHLTVMCLHQEPKSLQHTHTHTRKHHFWSVLAKIAWVSGFEQKLGPVFHVG